MIWEGSVSGRGRSGGGGGGGVGGFLGVAARDGLRPRHAILSSRRRAAPSELPHCGAHKCPSDRERERLRERVGSRFK